MAEEINGLNIVAKITPEVDLNKAKKAGEELKSTLEHQLDGLDFSASAVKAVEAVNKAAKAAAKTRGSYTSKGGKSKLSTLQSVEAALGGISPLALRDNKSESLAMLKKTREQLSQLKAAKGLSKSDISALLGDIDAAVEAVSRMRASKKMASKKANYASTAPRAVSTEKVFPLPVLEERKNISRSLTRAIESIDSFAGKKDTPEGLKARLAEASAELKSVFDNGKPLEEALTNAQNIFKQVGEEEFAWGHLLDKTSLPKTLTGIGLAAKTVDTSGLQRVAKAAPDEVSYSFVKRDIEGEIKRIQDALFQYDMVDHQTNKDRDAIASFKAKLEELMGLKAAGQTHVVVDEIKAKAESNAKTQLQAEHEHQVSLKARREELATKRAEEEARIRAAIAKFSGWGAHLGKGMNPLNPRRSGKVLKTNLDTLHAQGEALQYTKHPIFRKWDKSYRAGAWYTKQPADAQPTEEVKAATEAVNNATENLAALSPEFKQVYSCIGNLTDTTNKLINYLISDKARKNVRNAEARAKAEAKKAEAAVTKVAKEPTHPNGYKLGYASTKAYTLSDAIKVFGYGRKDSTGSESFKQSFARIQTEANRVPTTLAGWIENLSLKLRVALRQFQMSKFGVGFEKWRKAGNPVLSGMKQFRNERRERVAQRLEAKLKKKEESERIANLRARLHPSKQGKQGGLLSGLLGGAGKKFGLSFFKGTKSVLGFINTVKRAFRYRVVRNLVNRIIKLVREGFTNLDQYSEHMGTDFHQNALKLASSLLFLKNAFAAMVAPIVNYVTPALEKLMDTFAKLANYIGAFFAAITGQEQFTAALKKTVSKTQSAAGKLKDILAFDEINRLSGDTGSGENVDEMFEEWGNKDFYKNILNAFKNGQWAKLGKDFAKKVNDIVTNFDAEALGDEIGKRLGAAIGFASSFLENLSFSAMGSKLAKWFNKMISNVNWKDLGRLIARKFTAALEFFGRFILDLDWGTVAQSLSDAISGLFNGLGDWLKRVNWVQVGHDLTENIITFVKNIKWGEVAQSIINLLKGALKAVGGLIGGIIEEVLGINLPGWLKRLLGDGSTDVTLTAEISESVETHFNDETAGLFQALLKALGGPDAEEAVGVASEIANSNPNFVASSLAGDYNVPVSEQTLTETKSIGQTLRAILEKVGLITPAVQNSSATLRELLGKTTTSLPNVGTTSTKLMGGLVKRAGGGTVDKGQLFIANEAGPELIGNVGGKTTVTNQDQFTQGLIDANSMVVDAVLQVVKAVNNKNFDVYMDSQKVGKSVTNYQNNASRRYGV